MLRTEAVIDLSAISGNVATMKAGTAAEVMAVVKADGYGHGLVPSARAALAGGRHVARHRDRRRGRRPARGRDRRAAAVLAVDAGGGRHAAPRACLADVDISVSSQWQLDAVLAAVRESGSPARVHLKIDTGLSRNGSYVDDWPELVTSVAKAQSANEVAVIGVWSHFAYADEPGHPTIAAQIEAFRAALAVAARAGVEPQLRHLANSAATLTLPEAHFDLVRPGIAVYGLSPVAGDYGLTPAMTLRAGAASVKRVRAGEGVSYGHEYTASRATTLVLVPLGYADGVPRHAGNAGPVWINGTRFTVSGRVCMDQIVVDVGDLPVVPGDPVVLFGPGPRRRADGPGLGRRRRHDPLRDRHAHRAPGAAHLRPVMSARFTLPTVDDTRALGRRLAGVLRPGDLLVLSGPLGAGKTAFVQGLGAGLGVQGRVVSPTFVIARVHRAGPGGLTLVHVDAYRLGSLDEVDDLDLDVDTASAVTAVEWGTGVVEQLADARLEIALARADESEERTAVLTPFGGDWAQRIAGLPAPSAN